MTESLKLVVSQHEEESWASSSPEDNTVLHEQYQHSHHNTLVEMTPRHIPVGMGQVRKGQILELPSSNNPPASTKYCDTEKFVQV